jgi:hypothetical protein
MPAKKTVRWHPSVTDKNNHMTSNPAKNKAASKGKAQKNSSLNRPVANTSVPLSQGQPGVPYLNQLINGDVQIAYNQPSPLYSSAVVRPGASPANWKPAYAGSNLVMNTAALVEAANRSGPRTRNVPRANTSIRRSGGSSSHLIPRSKIAVPPWVPDAPPSGVLTPPVTPRPRRLPTPDLIPIDPWAYYPIYSEIPPRRTNPVIEKVMKVENGELYEHCPVAIANMSRDTGPTVS